MGWDALAVVVQEMPLVELNGYTLGGFYYANYEDSPAGPMDELVVLSGLVWNAPTSCAWASHVFVDKRSAVSHGKRVFGLPSRLSTFGKGREGKTESVTLRAAGSPVLELKRGRREGGGGSGGPKINFHLPSFSGRTRHKPELLKYDLDLSATIQPCKGYGVTKPATGLGGSKRGRRLAEHLGSILSGRRLASFAFKDMVMRVKHPEVVERGETGGGKGKRRLGLGAAT
ncbi:hypothetical protein HOP50_03g22900 [Chloropicon primus]|nr:hypothetical protein HOP50_03g22900 [Chloropicon primus]|mmetsp:Transcript_11944/g.33009  ORF Transcript_11944/g.33009 Transcript_11944/m.33009 type:complete len:229 (+) Transcript_11944:1839-2525(+)